MNYPDVTPKEIDYLLSPIAIRERCQKIFELSLSGKGAFNIHLDKLDDVSGYVLSVIKDNYPSLDIPFHSRWGHFQTGGIDRLKSLNEKLKGCSKYERVRAKLDLVLISVLLDAGAGNEWGYVEPSSGHIYARSEGLAIASFDMFLAGVFSNDKSNPLKVDAQALIEFSIEKLKIGFQVTDKNPLAGVEGRVNLLRSLGKVLTQNNSFFKAQRPGSLFDYLVEQHGKHLQAEHILAGVLNGFSDIWPGRVSINRVNMGDVWQYTFLQSEEALSSLVPFHKLSQWLTYSLIEPIVEAGVEVSGVEKLTGLAEYRNGGLLIDKQLIELKDKTLFDQSHLASSDLIIEWRALTIILLDKIGDKIRDSLNMSKNELPLAKVLEGGTWWAGRKAAKELRANGEPPLKLKSDGTVF
ncbi:URC4/urg3 family protein [Pseudoalteromonas denitrificans]|uniref:Uracil phosphoribosyltransferase n=1 Tax=Pseudoalteromonas denitrificans DSM 6059 TaxID=1123010 RepID=A0A1I1KKX3_9GAMM|nr:URC4/urg3 family protein [Pseudoalteromonas denitrificans]SFC61457.1 Protein of unknown function [Pseudoalteromonas denitrificans DSM 6059]